MAIEIEIGGQSNAGICADCDAPTRSVWGYALKDGYPSAAYFIHWTEIHRGRCVIALSLRGIASADPAETRMVMVECRMEDGYGRAGFAIVDAHVGPLHDPLLGVPQTREQVVGTALATETFAIVEVIARSDPRFHAILVGAEG